MKQIEFTIHALEKLEILKKHGFSLSQTQVVHLLQEPEQVEPGYKGRFVAQSAVDESHILRVIYETNGETITVVTLYPARRTRYAKDPIR